jgi:RimK family alpha-L-glutamate ligase
LTLRIGILSSQLGWHARALHEALLEHHVTPVFFPITRLAAWIGGQAQLAVYEERLEDCQAILVRTIPIGSLEQIVFRMDALHRLEDLGIRVLNPASSIERTVDKYYTSYLLADAGIPTPRTFITEDFEQAMTAFQTMGDVIVKPLFGSEGKGMTRVSDEDTAYRLFRHLELCRYIFYLQEYIPHADQDIRAFVIGGQVVAAMRRRGTNWKTNFSKGAQVEPLQLTDELQELSVRAARLVGTEYAGVDLLPAEDGRMYVLEVNSIPGWRGLRKTTSKNIASLIVEHALTLLEIDGVPL